MEAFPIEVHAHLKWYRTLRANVECARSELRRHRLQLRRSHYRFLRIGETLRPSRFHRRAVEFVVVCTENPIRVVARESAKLAR